MIHVARRTAAAGLPPVVWRGIAAAPTGRDDRRIALLALGLLLILTGSAAMLVGHESTGPFAAYPATVSALPSTYGPGIGADSLANTIVGGRDDTQVAYRFRATESADLESVRVYIVTGTGYSGGNGGRLRISLREDDPDRGHVPSGKTLAATVVTPDFGAGNVYGFPDPPRLVAGRLYHVVFTNVDPSPSVNYVSVNGLYTFGDHRARQPGFPRLGWAHLVRYEGSGGWSDDRGPGRGTMTPIMALHYANGESAGMGYMEVWYQEAKVISGQRRVREVFTVRGPSRRVSRISVRLKRLEGSGPLILRIEGPESGTIVEGRIDAAGIPLSSEADFGGSSWASLALVDTILESGREYGLVLEAGDDTAYSAFVIREGASYDYGPGTLFADGTAEHDDGQGWRPFLGWGLPSTEGDLQFSFDVQVDEDAASASSVPFEHAASSASLARVTGTGT